MNPLLQVGAIVAGRYTVDERSGAGGMGAVFRAHDLDGTAVALKVLRPRIGHSPARFAREVELLQRLSHPAIVRFLDSGSLPGGQPFLVMEWLQGQDLAGHLEAGPLTLGASLQIAERVARALAVAHEIGVVHRDVKPGNIFLPDGDVTRAKLIDFGVARWSHRDDTLTAAGVALGTPAYMAPEQVRGTPVDARADVFALGCVLHECLSGEPAFAAHHPMAAFCKILVEEASELSSLPDEMRSLLERMLAKDRACRPAGGADVAAAVAQVRRSLGELAERRLHALPALETEVSDGSGAHSPSSALTGGERRLLNVAVVSVDPLRPSQPSSDMPVTDMPMADTLPASVSAELITRLEALGASVDLLGGHSLLAVIDSAGTATDQACNAARCTLALARELPDSSISLATGWAEVDAQRPVGRVIERAIALLSQTTGAHAPGRREVHVHIDELTAGLLGGRFHIEQTARGLLLHGERSEVLAAQVLGQDTPFVGRRREMTMLLSTLDDCVEEDTARALLVTGRPGMGKTRLCQELVGRIRERGIPVWLAHGSPLRAGSPAGMMAEAVRRGAGIGESDEPEQAAARLRDRLARVLKPGDLPRVLGFIGELLRLPGDATSVQVQAARADARLMSDQTARACVDLIDAETRQQPLVIVFDDLHWCDRTTVALVDQVLRQLAERPLLIAALARPEVHAQFPRLWASHDITEVRLGRLPRKAAAMLARSVLPEEPEPAQLATLIERADGNAFYLEELLRSAARDERMLPETLLATVHARLELLEPGARRVLRAASVFGDQFWAAGISALLGENREVQEWLQQLIARELIRPSASSRFAQHAAYGFRHALVREGAYSMLTETDRALGHRLAGQWLQGCGERDHKLLAEHFERGGDGVRAAPLYADAAQSALDGGDSVGALELAARGVDCGAEGDVLGRLQAVQADAHLWLGQHEQVVVSGMEALSRLPVGSHMWCHAVRNCLHAWSILDRWLEVDALAERLLEVDAGDRDLDGWLVAMARLAHVNCTGGRMPIAAGFLRDIERITAEHGEALRPTTWARIHEARSRWRLVRGDIAVFLEELERGERYLSEAGDRRSACVIRINMGFARVELGLYEQAHAVLRDALDLAEAMGLDSFVAAALNNLGLTLGHLGRPAEGVQLERRAIALYDAQKNPRGAAGSRLYLANMLAMLGDLAAAEQEALAAVDQMPETNFLRPQALAMLSRVLLQAGKPTGALDASERALAFIEQYGGAEEGMNQLFLAHAEALSACGRDDEAALVVRRAARFVHERADGLGRDDWRESFLQRVPENARLLELEASLPDAS